MNYPAVLIGRLGVSFEFRGKGLNIGSQILDFLKGWFRAFHFCEKNGFKPLYKTEQEERDFLELKDDEPLETRFMFFDLKLL